MPNDLVTPGREEGVRSLVKELGNTQDQLYALGSMTMVTQERISAKNNHPWRL